MPVLGFGELAGEKARWFEGSFGLPFKPCEYEGGSICTRPLAAVDDEDRVGVDGRRRMDWPSSVAEGKMVVTRQTEHDEQQRVKNMGEERECSNQPLQLKTRRSLRVLVTHSLGIRVYQAKYP